MEVILLESFNKLGKIGDIVNVKDGFARNYLIPQKKALRANKDNKDHFTKIKKELIEKNNKIIEEAKKSLEKISGEEIIFIRNASDNGQLYGSVSPKDISNYFNQKQIDIKPSNINLHTAIKKVGIYNINIKLHAEVTCDLKINVATSAENANLQKVDLNKLDEPNESVVVEESKKHSDDKKNVSENENVKTKTVKKSNKKTETNTKSDDLIEKEDAKLGEKSNSDSKDIKTKNIEKLESKIKGNTKSESLEENKEDTKLEDKSEQKE